MYRQFLEKSRRFWRTRYHFFLVSINQGEIKITPFMKLGIHSLSPLSLFLCLRSNATRRTPEDLWTPLDVTIRPRPRERGIQPHVSPSGGSRSRSKSGDQLWLSLPCCSCDCHSCGCGSGHPLLPRRSGSGLGCGSAVPPAEAAASGVHKCDE